jgi:hypothetical protein
MRQKKEFPNVGGGVQDGDTSHLPPSPVADQDLCHKKVVKFGQFRQARKLPVGSKLVDEPHVDVTFLTK